MVHHPILVLKKGQEDEYCYIEDKLNEPLPESDSKNYSLLSEIYQKCSELQVTRNYCQFFITFSFPQKQNW